MLKKIILFLCVAATSYIFFTWLSAVKSEESQLSTINNMPSTETKVAVKKENTKDSLAQLIDTTLFTKMPSGAYDISWQQLSKVDFNEIFVDSMDAYVPFPVFHPEIEYLEGEEIVIKGYVIPIEETGDDKILVLSANPFTSCFFCGGAGPETVMDIKLQSKAQKRYTRDSKVTFKGKLRLNDSDLYYLNYILEDAIEMPNQS